MKSILTVALLLSSSFSGAASLQCAPLFSDEGVFLSSDRFSAKKQADKNEVKSMTLEVLKMTAQTRDAVFNEKEVVEKGVLILGQPLKEGWSLEFEYVADHRALKPVFRLKQISVVKPNGDRTSLEKGALSLDNASFNKSYFGEDALGVSIPRKNIEAPLVLGGDLYNNIIYWAARAEFLRHQELQNLEGSLDAGRLKGKMWVRSTALYTKNIIKKQSFKFAILGVVFYLYNNQGKMISSLSISDPWEGLLKSTSELLATSKGYLIFETELNKNLATTERLPFYASTEDLSLTKSKSIFPKLEKLSQIEGKLGSQAVVHIAKDGQIMTLNQNIGDILNSVTNIEEGTIVVSFPRQKRLVLLKYFAESEKFAFMALDSNTPDLEKLYTEIAKKLPK